MTLLMAHADGSVWEREQLRDRYLKYAATDAFAQLLLFHALRELLHSVMSTTGS
jgi:hypothetical protein